MRHAPACTAAGQGLGALQGEVSAKSGPLQGKLVVDINHESRAEVVAGRTREFRGYFPLRLVQGVSPKSGDLTRVELTEDRAFEVSGFPGLTSANAGMLVVNEDATHYVKWDAVEWVVLK